MSGVIYNPPDEYLNIFNPINYFYDTGAGISISTADARYLKKAGDTATGIINFSSGLATADGSNGTPYGLSFINDTNTGYYRIGADNLGISCGGVKQIDISTTSTLFTNPIILPAGSLTTPAVAIAESNLGIYRNGPGNLSFSIGGVEHTRMSSGGLFVLSTNGVRPGNGSLGAPAYNFYNEINTGIRLNGAGDMRQVLQAVDKFGITSSTNTSYQNLSMNSNNIISCPKVQNLSGNVTLECNTTGAGGSIVLSGGTGLLSATSGGSAGTHLVLTINGTQYKIALLNV